MNRPFDVRKIFGGRFVNRPYEIDSSAVGATIGRPFVAQANLKKGRFPALQKNCLYRFIFAHGRALPTVCDFNLT